MTTTDLLDEKLEEYRARLAKLDALREAEVSRPIARQNARLLRFVYRERCVYRFALLEVSAIRAHARGRV